MHFCLLSDMKLKYTKKLDWVTLWKNKKKNKMKLHGFMKYFRFHQFENLKIWVLANFMLLKLPKYAFLTFLKIKISTLNNFCEATISHLLQITSSTLSKIDLGLGTHFYQLDCILINLFQFCVKSIFPNILFS